MENKVKKEYTNKSDTTTPLHSLLKNESRQDQETHKKPLFENLDSILKKDIWETPKTQETAQEREKRQTDNSALEKLLHSDASQDIQPHIQKTADTLDVKIHEAKQMMKHLGQDIKKALEEYKPPFSRVKVKLNPQRLGEIDLTVVQRGKNIHINLSSNNTALHLLTHNLQELKMQLSQNGINNASFNFNGDAHHQQQKEKERNRKNEYEYFTQDEEHEEQSRQLEIIVPRYI